MSFDKVEVRVFSGPDQVQVGSNTEPDLIVINNGPKGDKGDKGDTGATGAAGPNSVTSATTSDGTAELSVDTISGDGSGLTGLVSSQITDASTTPVYNETTELYEEVAVLYNEDGELNALDFISNGSFRCYISDTQTASFTSSPSPINVTYGSNTWRINNPAADGTRQWNLPTSTSGTFAITSNIAGVPDKLTDGTIAGTLAINTTSYTYGAGAAAAHRTALGVSASADTVLKSAYTPSHSLLVQQSGTGSPSSLSVGNNTILGRASGGGSNIAALSGSDARTVLGLSTLATTTPAVNVATFLESPTSANLAAAVTGETGTGALVFGTSPTIDAPTISGSAAFTSTTRPTSAGTGTPAATSLITRNDAALDRLLSIGQLIHINAASMATSIGFGGFAGGGNDEMNLVSNTTANGYARAQVSRDMGIWGGAGLASAQIPMTFAFPLIISIPASGNTEYAFVVGEVGSGAPIALGSNPLIGRGFGFRMFYSVANARNEVQLFAHNGTTYSESASIAMASTSSPVMTVVLSSDGAGNVKLLLGTPVGPIWQHVRPSLTPVLSLATGPFSGSLGQGFASHLVRNGSTAPTASLGARPKNMIMEVGNVLF